MKISEIKYVRPDKEQVLAHLADIRQRMENAQTLEDFYAVHDEYKAYSEDLGTNMRIAFIRFTQDTRNEFYAAAPITINTIQYQAIEKPLLVLLR